MRDHNMEHGVAMSLMQFDGILPPRLLIDMVTEGDIILLIGKGEDALRFCWCLIKRREEMSEDICCPLAKLRAEVLNDQMWIRLRDIRKFRIASPDIMPRNNIEQAKIRL